MAIRELAQQAASAGGNQVTGRRPLPRSSMLTLGIASLVAFWAFAALSDTGRVAYTYVFYFLHFYAGVFVLMGLTGTIMFGLIATDRIVLNPRTRVWMQVIHRGMGMFSMSFLAVHVWTKATGGSISLINAIIPFTSNGPTVNPFLGLGPLSAYLMLLITWTGIARSRFVHMANPRIWRLLHSTAYLTWPLTLLHGLGAGRRPADWVTFSYLLCVLGVSLALILRFATSRGRKNEAGRMAQTTMAVETVGGQARTVTIPERGRADEERDINPLADRWDSSAKSWDTATFAVISQLDDEDDLTGAPEPQREATAPRQRRAPLALTAGPEPEPQYEPAADAALEYDDALDYEGEDDYETAGYDRDPGYDRAAAGYDAAPEREYTPRRAAEYVPKRAARSGGRHASPEAEPRRASGRSRVPSAVSDAERAFLDMEPDDTPTLVNLAARRELRASSRRPQTASRYAEDEYAEEPTYLPRWREAQ